MTKPPITEGTLLWSPTPETIANANLTKFTAWLFESSRLNFTTYAELWQWSVTEVEAFWAAWWEYWGVVHAHAYDTVLAERTMPGAQWFVGAKLNYAENILTRRTAERPALLYQSETTSLTAISWQTLSDQTAKLAHALRNLGVQRGDRVVAYLPNIPEAVVGLLATASIGAIWSSCSPDFGSRGVLDRFGQIAPKVLLAVDGYHYGGKYYDRRTNLAELQAALPTLVATILVETEIATESDTESDTARTHPLDRHRTAQAAASVPLIHWSEIMNPDEVPPLHFAQVPFDQPLWILYSSGTTGLPKPIVQGHGGILLEHSKATILHNDLHPGDRFFWYSSTGWMMWNYLVGSLLSGATAILYNGSPGYPDLSVLWRLAAESGMTYFGTSAAFLHACMKAGIHPGRDFDLHKLRGLGSTGSPLSIDGFRWVYDEVSPTLALESLSGGTDLCTAFVGGARTLPIHAGELQGPSLGAQVAAWNEAGEPVIDEVGELVITQPMPSMPLYFWNDTDNLRYLESYFDLFPGVWRHGDWIKINERMGCVIYGRSDSTINRQGIRMGTSEIYRVVESFPEVVDSLVIDLEALGQESYMPLFVVLREGAELTEELQAAIKRKIREEISPRHTPNDIFAIEDVPYTLSGKKMEVPIRKILLGQPLEKAVKRDAMRNPEALAYFLRFRQG
ncbi:MAG TPA: acetoacetate--CoA ligase [Caldilineaceae bacterium]|nr:acetoacetate--CoA ligase [Caldilineaceae bacterium]